MKSFVFFKNFTHVLGLSQKIDDGIILLRELKKLMEPKTEVNFLGMSQSDIFAKTSL